MRFEKVLERCALVFATPVSEEDYYIVMDGGPLKDYAAATLRGQPAAYVWNARYKDIAVAAQELIQTALRLGAKVYTQAGLSEVAEATEQCDTLILIAHWRGASFNPAELRVVYDDLVQAWLKNRSHPAVALLGSPPRDAESLAARLNSIIVSGDLLSCLPEPIATAGRRSSTLGQTLSRDLLDELFAEVAPPGNRLELYDGLHTPATFEEAIAPKFEGELDLTTCSSQALATLLDLRRKDRIHHLHWPDLIDPLPQFVLIEAALRHMAETSRSYIHCRLAVERLL